VPRAGVPRLDDIAERVQEVIEPEIPTNFLEKLKMLPKLARLADFVRRPSPPPRARRWSRRIAPPCRSFRW